MDSTPMMPQPGDNPSGFQTVAELDPVKVQAFNEQLHAEQNLILGALGGGVAMFVGALIWAAITYFTDYQIGWMAVGVGALVGVAIRFFGRGVDKIFGFMGAGLAAIGCLAGNLFWMAAAIASQESVPLLDVVIFMVANPMADLELLAETFHPMDLLFYGLALYYGYRFSFRTVSEAERKNLYRFRTIAQ